MLFVSNKTQLASALGIDMSVLSHHLGKPHAPKKTDKGWDVDEVKRWHTAEIAKHGRLPAYEPPGEADTREGSDTPPESPKNSLAALKLREAKAKAEERELKVARLKGEQIEKTIVRKVAREFVNNGRTQMLSIVTLAPELAIMSDVAAIEELLRREVFKAMEAVVAMPYLSHDNDPK